MDYNIGLENHFAGALDGLKNLFIPHRGNNWRPVFISSKILLWAVVLIFAVKIISVGISLPLPQNWFFADITKVDLLSMLNQNRQAIGAQPLVDNPKLDQAAMLKAQDMVAKGYFAHQSPQGITPWYWFRQVGYNYKYAGENLAVGFVNSDEVFDAWLNSPSHKANIDNPNYRDVGTAVLSGFQGNSIVVVQVFGSAQAAVKPVATTAGQTPTQKPTPAPKPASVATPKPAPVPEPTPAPVSAPSQTETPAPTTPAESSVVQASDAAPKVLGGETQIVQPQASQPVISNAYGSFINFLVYDYQKAVTYLVLILLIIVSLSSLLNIMVNFDVQRPGVIATSMAISVLLVATLALNPQLVSHVIPHQIII
jgi:hypothetical protein